MPSGDTAPASSPGWTHRFLQALLPAAGERQNHRILFLSSAFRRNVQFVEKCPHIRRRLHHLVGGSEIGPVGKAKNSGDLLSDGQQIQQDLPVLWKGACVVCQEHPPAKSRQTAQRSLPADSRENQC